MGLAEFTQSTKWKTLMKYVYGWGAAVVLVGALFKLTHWPGATAMLTVGLLVEAGIFIMSAFEPLHEEVDWTLVYPELAGVHSDVPAGKGKGKDRRNNNNNNVATSNVNVDGISKFNEMLSKAGEDNLFEKFGKSLQALNEKAGQMSDISDAALATENYAKNMNAASKSVKDFSEKYSQVAETITSSVETVNYSVENFADSFNKVNLDFSGLENGSSQYSDNMSKLNKNLSALNAIFELQLNEADLEKMMEDLQGSVTHSAKYHTEITALGQKLEKLNNVYGNMLAAMNVK